MMCRHFSITLLTLAATVISVSTAPVCAETQVTASYLYSLADFQGPVESLWARVTIDPEEGEVYTLDRSDASISIFNTSAMQVFSFGEGLRLASASDIASGDNGEMFVLYRQPAGTIRHLDYRGDTLEDIRISLSSGAVFQPDYLDYQAGKLYLADSGSMQVLVTTPGGDILQQHDIRALLTHQIDQQNKPGELNQAQMKKIREDRKKLSGAVLGGFSADRQGNLYFTVSSIFQAYRMSPEGEIEAFGIPGSAPGKFGVVAGITADNFGNIYVADRLRCVVLIFDQQLNYRTEFGYRGDQAHNLVVPDDIAFDQHHQRIYVAQAANRGVNVYNLAMNQN